MSNYISSNANRFYAALEALYGQAAPVTAENRFPAVRMAVRQNLEQGRRRDKTGSRTFLGTPKNSRRMTAFETLTYLTSWSGAIQPAYGPLFQAALGGAPVLNAGLTVLSVAQPILVATTAPHGLSPGSAVSMNGEIRFVSQVPDSASFALNAPFTVTPAAGAVFSPAITYTLASNLPSLTLYDYWDPAGAVHRVAAGAGVDHFQLVVNGDFHEFAFRGPAADVIDASSFIAGQAGLATFPAEPALSNFDYSVVPGHLGQVWIGNPSSALSTLTAANIRVENGLDTRHREYGATLPLALAPGPRRVFTNFSLLAQSDSQTAAFYAAARARTPLPAMLQLGEQQGQLMGVYLSNVTPEVPAYNDGESRLQWDFTDCQAQGQTDDEISIAFA